ncbi:single-strand DNA-binding protein [Variovorax sp. HW608]|uniref:single-stranded DNA-binding protein n=1 Tax=Variovorax sp. HW608 TaxID=1034889 RepID=UPI00081FC429|nr:single-stranded DNA-binding protein [Variovorax sp. HW608]SCK55706.1 single-strand DNA-binding protein [Variovorax sp. HW608]
MQNLFIGKGNLAKSPEGQYIQRKDGHGDFFVASMRVMFGRYGRKDDGSVEQVGGFWREVEIYGQKAQDVCKHLRKGARVLVIGEEREFTGTDDSGAEVQVLKVVAEDVALQLTRIEEIKFAPARQREEELEDAAP